MQVFVRKENAVATVAEVFALALQHHEAGHLIHAGRLYKQILCDEPHHADAHHGLGVLALQRGDYESAITLIRQAVGLNPADARYYSNLGLAQEALGKLQEAEASYEQAIRLQPDLADAHDNLANTLRRQGRLERAVTQCREALRLRPGFPEAHSNLGNILLDLGKLDEAVTHYRLALRARPNYAKANNNLGIALERQGKTDEAICCFRDALRMEANYAEAYYNLGNALEGRSQWEEVVDCYRKALHWRPHFAEAHNNLGSVLLKLGYTNEASVHLQEAIRLNPNHARYHFNLGCAYLEQGHLHQGVARFEETLRLEPGLAAAQSNRLLCLNCDPNTEPDALFEEHRRWGQMQELTYSPMRTQGPSDWTASAPDALTDCNSERRLRVGYVSPDFRFHPVTRYLETVLANHDLRHVEVFCYAEVFRPDAVTTRLQRLVQNWRVTRGLTDAEVAQRIRNDRIDILVDLAGHTANNRLCVFAYKPAPVQVAWLGYMNTSGLTSMDYRLTDAMLDPPEEPIRDTEQLVRLPNGMCCFTAPLDAPEVAPLPALKRRHLTFGSLHGLLKVNAVVLDMWAHVLKAVPTARLLMFHHNLVPTLQDHIRQQLLARGIADGRLDLREGSCKAGYLGIYNEIDVSLDTFPCTGGVTTCESLWMGVPMLSLCGKRPASRNSAALLMRVGLTDWIVHSPELYVAQAARAASNLESLAQLRAGLRTLTRGRLCDGQRFTRELEDVYRRMWRRRCSNVSS
jgi:predicted O-linked N-acetylglucosamine transferase (SPINDLY family)